MALYLLHSDVPLVRSNGVKVSHYLGYAPDGEVGRRLEDHLHNRSSSKLVQAFLDRKAFLFVGRVWPGLTYADEHRIKRNGHLSSHCYLCLINELQDFYLANLEDEGVELIDGRTRSPKLSDSTPPSSSNTSLTSTSGRSGAARETSGTSSSSTSGRSTPGNILGNG